MDWSTLAVVAVVGGFLLWRFGKAKQKTEQRAEAATQRLTRDNRLYQHIKSGMREYDWRRQDEAFQIRKHGELIFETAHMAAYKVVHFAEARVGFYFKDLNEYGLYGFFAGNGDDYFESYYRTDKTFQEEGRLLHDDH